jgi:DNA-binding SARP family transcriptional activator
VADDPTAVDLSRLLHQLRRREARRRGGAELSYRELAARTGWSLGIVAHYFSGKTLPPVDRFDALVRLLGASPAEQGALATMRDRVDERRRGRSRPATAMFRLLGAVQVVGPDGAARLVGVRQRALVGLLAVNAGRAVTQIRLIDALWGEDPPRTAVRTLYSHVARVRQALDACGLRGVLRTDGVGYLLAVRPDEVDAGQFEARVAQARKALADGTVGEVATLLRDALDLWRGDAFADAPAHAWGAAEVDRLHEVRLAAQEDLWDARLRLGDHAGAVGEIDKLLVSHPGRERLVELLMLAHYRTGQPAEALDAFQRLRVHLAENLGVEPGPRVQRLHTAILRRDADLDLVRPAPSRPPRPAQLPPRVGHFTGRGMELAVLDDLPPDGRRVGVVSGPGGMGKTALAVQWADRTAGRYPDGQLFLDLRGHDPATSLRVGEALTHLLAGLGVPADQIPADPTNQIGLYRSVLHRRRVLILLDNAGTADQVGPLVPPQPSQLLVTSRNRLTGLAVDHEVTTVDLEVLPAGDALALLGRVLGADRVAAEQAAARRLMELCGRMPLALRISAAKLTARPRDRISTFVTELSGTDRLDALSVPGDSRSIRTVFAGAYRALSPSAAVLFRRLGVHPGPSFTTGLAAALAQESGQAQLDELAAAHLVVVVDAGRYRFHDLIGLYARECARTEEAVQAAAQIIDWYLTTSDAANQAIESNRDRDEALAFLDAERTNLLPVVRLAADRGDDRAVWRLANLLTSYHKVRGLGSAQVELCGLGLASARRLGDSEAEALMRSALGAAFFTIQRYEDAIEHLTGALALMRAAGDLRGQGRVLNNVALAYVHTDRFDLAMETFQESLVLHRANDHRPGIATALNNIGHTYLQMRQYEPARTYLQQGLALTRELGLAGHEAFHLQSLGETHLAEGDPAGALEHLAGALAIRRRLGERRLEADTLTAIGIAHRDRGDRTAAVAHFRQVVSLARELGDQQLEAATAAHLAGSDSQDPHDRLVVDDRPRHGGDLDLEPSGRRPRRSR